MEVVAADVTAHAQMSGPGRSEVAHPRGGLRWGYNGRSEQAQARVSGLAAAGGAGQGPPWAALARPQPPAAVTAEPRPLSRYLASAEPGQSE